MLAKQGKLSSAFTLVELVVVVVIIASLAGLFLPMVAASREKGRRAACAIHLEQIALGLTCYAGDYGGYLPTWIGSGVDDWGLGRDWDGDGDIEGTYRQCAARTDDGPCEWKSDADQWHHYTEDARTLPYLNFGVTYKANQGLPLYVRDTSSLSIDVLSDFRVIGIGTTTGGNTLGRTGQVPDYWDPRADEDGTVIRNASDVPNFAPHGLGHLIIGDYISDARQLYCPSAEDMLPGSTAWAGGWNLDHWKAAGGYGKDAMLWNHGWPTNGDTNGDPWPTIGTIYSHYSYRGVPLMGIQPWCSWYEDKDPMTMLAFTRPGIFTHYGAPYFRTEKELAGRAIASDTFSKTCMARYESPDMWRDALNQPYNLPAAEAETKAHPGMGIKGHRTGYNVLYGDGHVQFYDDPNEQIIWCGQGTGAWNTARFTPDVTSNNNAQIGNQFYWAGEGPMCESDVPGFGRNGVTNQDSAAWKYSSAAIWHRFDNDAGLDQF